MVERMVAAIAARPLDAALRDLCQMVYLALLEYDPDRVSEMYARGEIRFFVARIILTQIKSSTSPYYRLLRSFSARSRPLEGVEPPLDGEM